jgi:hypothetical protein
MAWANGPLAVFHGTDSTAALSIRSGINSAHFRPRTDFGAGSYMTTVLKQAQQWANQQARRSGTAASEVLEYRLSRNPIEPLAHLTFTAGSADYYDFVAYCRAGEQNHGPYPCGWPYDIVYDPVSLWPQVLVVANCDQILLLDHSGLGKASVLYARSRPQRRTDSSRELTMPQIDPRDLDHSPEMKTYFEHVTDLPVTRHGKARQQARPCRSVLQHRRRSAGMGFCHA